MESFLFQAWLDLMEKIHFLGLVKQSGYSKLATEAFFFLSSPTTYFHLKAR